MQPFSHLMQQWLYGKEGYYQNHKIGKDGDFYTSVSVSPFLDIALQISLRIFSQNFPPSKRLPL